MEDSVLDCGLTDALSVMSGKWKPLVLWELSAHGSRRFSELRRALTPITEKVLTQQLRELEAHGLLNRTVHPVVPPHVEYGITELGRSLDAALRPLGEWGDANRARLRRLTGSGASVRPT